MSKLFFWIVLLPLAAVIIVFSVNNRTEVALDLWPLGVVTAPVPVFAVMLFCLVAGFLAGGVVAWNAAGRTRRRARAEARRADQAERELTNAQDRIKELQAAATPAEDSAVPSLPSNAA
ncbi:MAG: DUF1049 domain-containing protein [Alphaproteobacteria bacterium]|nr:DUF1049 domain-containing protein [Alphaproteobacteria bacterium]MBT7943229.1 DUF1049 domain-containing protein [Alphaproteobacteria bacterium]